MIAIFVAIALYALVVGAEVSMGGGLGAAVALPEGVAIAVAFLGAVLIAFPKGGKKKLGAHLVQWASVLFLPLGVVGILGARRVLSENEPLVPPTEPGKPAACFRFGWGKRLIVGGGVFALAGLLLGPSVGAAGFAIGVTALIRGVWSFGTPAVWIAERHIELNRSMWAPRRVVRRKEVDSYDLSGNRLVVNFERDGQPLMETVRVWGLSNAERERLGAALDAFLASKGKKRQQPREPDSDGRVRSYAAK